MYNITMLRLLAMYNVINDNVIQCATSKCHTFQQCKMSQCHTFPQCEMSQLLSREMSQVVFVNCQCFSPHCTWQLKITQRISQKKLNKTHEKCTKKCTKNARKMHENWTKTGRQSKSSAAPCPRAASRCREIDFRFVAADYRRLSQILTFSQINTMYIITWWLQWALKLWESVRFS